MIGTVVIAMTVVGEEIAFEALDKLIAHTPKPYRLVIWYDTRGRGLNEDYLKRLQRYTDDVIVSYQNHRLVGSWGYFAMYLPYDYLIITAPDFLVAPDYFDRLMKPFCYGEKVGLVGEAWRKMDKEYVYDDFDRGPDGIFCVSRKAINEVGGFSPSFNGRGPFHQEIYRRMARNGWHYAAVDGLCVHGGLQHEGRDQVKDWEKELHQDNLVWLRMQKKDYQNYRWFADDN